MRKFRRVASYLVFGAVAMFGSATASAWQFAGGESFDGQPICKLISVDEYKQVVFGLINGQVILASPRPLNVVMQDGKPDVERGFGMRMDGEFFQGTIHHDPRHADRAVTITQMYMGPYGKAHNDRFAAQDTVKVRTVLGREPLQRTYNMGGLQELYPKYAKCMGW